MISPWSIQDGGVSNCQCLDGSIVPWREDIAGNLDCFSHEFTDVGILLCSLTNWTLLKFGTELSVNEF